jgi:hypothetical protein
MKKSEKEFVEIWELYQEARRQKLPKFLNDLAITDERKKDSLFFGFCMGYRFAKDISAKQAITKKTKKIEVVKIR